VVDNEVSFVPVPNICFIEEPPRTLDLIFENKQDSSQNVAVERKDLNDEPHVDARQFNFWLALHLVPLSVKDSGLVLKNGHCITTLFQNVVPILVANFSQYCQDWSEDMG
jgi:hypothetical protein